MANVTVVVTAEQLAAAAARRVTALIEAAIAARQRAAICLTGGNTPERLYQLLADGTQPWRNRIDWSHLQVFWGDERHVAPDHPDSNYGMAYRTLLSRVPIPPDNIHRIHCERSDAHEAAHEYEAELRTVRLPPSPLSGFGATSQPDRFFDVMLLGVGEDAHIASIFPRSPLLANLAGREGPPYDAGDLRGPYDAGDLRGRAALHGPPGLPNLVAAVFAAHLNAWRITLTPSAVLNSRTLLVMASGARKANAVRAALVGPDDVSRYPAQLVRGAEWLIDGAAAQLLDGQHG